MAGQPADRSQQGTKKEMSLLFESWCMANENRRNSTVYVQVTERSGTIRRGVKKWMTRAEMEKKWDTDITDAIIAYKNSSKSICEEEVRPHPDAPTSQALPADARC